ncbi:hypothetical protein [Flavobacterium sp.]|uniref:hypothetical protein n=1 Tax=Flavobacterium sp. TaxID=239 RepID=UPI002637D8FC|nr:hypothetical protein [Flavobacterium sp.]
MNLENLNLVELNAQEVKETEGGLFGLDDLVVGVLVGAAVQIMGDWENFEAGLNGYPPRKK